MILWGAFLSLAPISLGNAVYVLTVLALTFIFLAVYAPQLPKDLRTLGDYSHEKRAENKTLVFGEWVQDNRRASNGQTAIKMLSKIPFQTITLTSQLLAFGGYLFLTLGMGALSLHLLSFLHLSAATHILLASHRGLMLIPSFVNLTAVIVSLSMDPPLWAKLAVLPYSFLLIHVLVLHHRDTLEEEDKSGRLSRPIIKSNSFRGLKTTFRSAIPLWLFIALTVWVSEGFDPHPRKNSLRARYEEFLIQLDFANRWAGNWLTKSLKLDNPPNTSDFLPVGLADGLPADPELQKDLLQIKKDLAELDKELEPAGKSLSPEETKKRAEKTMGAVAENLQKLREENSDSSPNEEELPTVERQMAEGEDLRMDQKVDMSRWEEVIYTLRFADYNLVKSHLKDLSYFKTQTYDEFHSRGWSSKESSQLTDYRPPNARLSETIEVDRAATELPYLGHFYGSYLYGIGEKSSVRIQLTGGDVFRLKRSKEALTYYLRLYPKEQWSIERPPQALHRSLVQGQDDFNVYLGQKAQAIFGTSRDVEKRISLLRAHFQRENFRYDIETLTKRQQKDAVSQIRDFLETERRGHCELYAGATVLLFRAHGTPARLVTGYRITEDPFLGSLQIRKKNAHAWVEIWNDFKQSWTYFDTTVGDDNSPLVATGAPLNPISSPERKDQVKDRLKQTAEAIDKLKSAVEQAPLDPQKLKEGLAEVREKLTEAQSANKKRRQEDLVEKTLEKMAEQKKDLAETTPQELQEKFSAAEKATEELLQHERQITSMEIERNQSARNIAKNLRSIKNLAKENPTVSVPAEDLESVLGRDPELKQESSREQLKNGLGKLNEALKKTDLHPIQKQEVEDLMTKTARAAAKNDQLNAMEAPLKKMREEKLEKAQLAAQAAERNLKDENQKSATNENVASSSNPKDEEGVSAALQSLNDLSNNEEPAPRPEVPTEKTAEDESTPRILTKDEMSSLQSFLRHLPLLGILLLLSIGGYRFLRARMGLKSHILETRISREDYERLKGELSRLEKTPMKAEQEIVLRFNVSLELLQRLQYQRDDGLPIEDYNRQLPREMHEKLRSPFENMLPLFCRTIYGRETISESELTSLRRESRALFRQAKKYVTKNMEAV